MKNTLKFALTATLLAASPLASAEAIDCVKLTSAVKAAVVADAGNVLDIVAKNVAANESCACEIVKSAILASGADKAQVAKIAEVAILEAPSQLRVIAQCAIATAPESASNVQALLEKYEAAGGDGYSAKGVIDDSKDAGPVIRERVSGANPLDFPGGPGAIIGPRPGEDPTPGIVLNFDPVDTDPIVTAIGETGMGSGPQQ